MNINIYLFSHIPKNDNISNNFAYSISDLPSSNKIAKIIKALMINFSNFPKKYFLITNNSFKANRAFKNKISRIKLSNISFWNHNNKSSSKSIHSKKV